MIAEWVQTVRSRLHNDIQHLHGTMPLWGVDYWVTLGKLFSDRLFLPEVCVFLNYSQIWHMDYRRE